MYENDRIVNEGQQNRDTQLRLENMSKFTVDSLRNKRKIEKIIGT